MEDFFKKLIDVKIVPDEPDKAYHAKKDYISSSMLKELKVSPAHWKYKERKEEDTAAQLFGSAYHCIILQPELFEQKYYIFDEKDIFDILISEGAKVPRATNKYKDWYFDEENKAAGRQMIDINFYKYINEMKGVIYKHPYARSLVSNGLPELSVYTEIELFTGQTVRIKIRADYFKDKKKLITDLKSARNASEGGFTKDAANLEYYIQAALYTDIISFINNNMPHKFLFIAQEKTRPYAFNLFEASSQFLSCGRYEYEQLILLYLQCVENNQWPGYQVFCENKYGVLDLSLPPWAIKELNFYNHKFL